MYNISTNRFSGRDNFDIYAELIILIDLFSYFLYKEYILWAQVPLKRDNRKGCENQPRSRRCKCDEIYKIPLTFRWEGVESRMNTSQKTCLRKIELSPYGK